MNTKTMLRTASALALALGATTFTATPAMAEDCFLDTDGGDGFINIDLTTLAAFGVAEDTTGGANSQGTDERLACGVGAQATGPGSTALGFEAGARRDFSVAVGHKANVVGDHGVALGAEAVVRTDATDSIVIGYQATTWGTGSIVLGTRSRSTGNNSIVIGADLDSDQENQILLGNSTNYLTVRGIANGNAAQSGTLWMLTTDANGNIGVADIPTGGSGVVVDGTGNGSLRNGANVAEGDGAVALGLGQTAQGNGAVAIGDPNTATGTGAVAIGADNTATGDGAVAMGNGTGGIGLGAVAMGDHSGAIGTGAVALGNQSAAEGNGAVALGNQAHAALANTVAIGTSATASQANSVALGNQASATGANSVALGNGSTAVEDNTVAVGSSGQQRRVVYVAAGVAATDAVNVAQLNAAVGGLAAVNSQQDLRLSALESSLGTLFNLADLDRKNHRQGIAAAMAQVDAPFPSEPGKTSYAGKAAMYRGEYAVSFSLSHRLDTENPFALTASVSQSGGKNTGVTVGFAGEF